MPRKKRNTVIIILSKEGESFLRLSVCVKEKRKTASKQRETKREVKTTTIKLTEKKQSEEERLSRLSRGSRMNHKESHRNIERERKRSRKKQREGEKANRSSGKSK